MVVSSLPLLWLFPPVAGLHALIQNGTLRNVILMAASGLFRCRL